MDILDSSFTGRFLLEKLAEKIRDNDFSIVPQEISPISQSAYSFIPMRFNAEHNAIIITDHALDGDFEETKVYGNVVFTLAHEIFHSIMHSGEEPSRSQQTIKEETMATAVAQLVVYEQGLFMDRRNVPCLSNAQDMYSYYLNATGLLYYPSHEKTAFEKRESEFDQPFWADYIEKRKAFVFSMGPTVCKF